MSKLELTSCAEFVTQELGVVEERTLLADVTKRPQFRRVHDTDTVKPTAAFHTPHVPEFTKTEQK